MTIPETHYSGPDLCALPAREAVKMLKAGDIAPDDLLDAALTRIAEVEPLCGGGASAASDELDDAI